MRSRPFQLALSALLLTALTLHLFAPPAWWSTRSVLTADSSDDYAVLNQGQLKNFMRGAIEEMNANLPGGAGAELNALLATWRTDTSGADDFVLANQGQLKAMGKKLRTRLSQLGIPSSDIGTPSITADDDDHSPANLGQAKSVFNFLLQGDTDGDGINDTWELAYFNTLTRNLRLDTDGDGISDEEEYARKSDPTSWQNDQVDSPGLVVFTALLR